MVRISHIVCLLSLLWAANSLAITGQSPSTGDIKSQNGRMILDCSGGGVQVTGSPICGTGRASGQVVIGGTGASESLTLQSTSHSTKGSILFGGSSYDEPNDRLGLLTPSPATTFHLSGSLGEVQMDSSGTSVSVARYGAASSFAIRGASGSKGSPALTANGLTVGNFDFQGLTNTGSGTFVAGARLTGTATETWSGSVNGMQLGFATTLNGTNTLTTRALFTNAGSLQLLQTGSATALLFQATLSDNQNFQTFFNNTNTYTTAGPNLIPTVPLIMRNTATFTFAGATSTFVQAALINEQHWNVADGTTLTSNTNSEGAFRDAVVFEKYQNSSCGSGTGNPWPCCTGIGTGTCAGTGALGASARYWSFETEPHVVGLTLPEYGAFVADTAVTASGGAITNEIAFWVKSMVGSTKIAFQSDDTVASMQFAGAARFGATGAPTSTKELDVQGNALISTDLTTPQIYGGTATSSSLDLTANNNTWGQSNTGRIQLHERVTWPDNYIKTATGFVSLLDYAGTVTGPGLSNVQFSGFFYHPTIQWDTAQSSAVLAAFYAKPVYQPTAVVTDVSTTLMAGFVSQPAYTPSVTSGSPVTPLLAGYYTDFFNGITRSSTATPTITNLIGFNFREPTFGSSANVQTGVTATLVAGLRMGNAIGSGTVMELAGVDLDDFTKGGTNISLRSAGAAVQMRHNGPVTIGANAAPNAGAILDLGQNTAKTVILPKLTTATRDALTAADGMFLYNSDLDETEARAGGAWEDVSQGSDRSHVFWGHANADTTISLSGTGGTNTFASGGGTASCNSSTCSGTVAAAVSGVGFMLNLPTGTTSGNTCAVFGGASCGSALQTRYAFHPVATFRIKTDASAVTTTRVWCGLFSGDPSQSDSPTTLSLAGFRFSTGASDTTFKGVTCNASACTVSGAASATVAAATEYTLRIDARNASQVKFTVNGTNLVTNSATLPVSGTSLSAHCVITTLAASARTLAWGFSHVRDQAY